MADAKPFWSALYQSVSLVDADDYEYRRSSICEMLTQFIGLIMLCTLLKTNNLVAREGVESTTPAFSELTHPVFPTTSMVAVGLPNTGKYGENERTVGDRRG